MISICTIPHVRGSLICTNEGSRERRMREGSSEAIVSVNMLYQGGGVL